MTTRDPMRFIWAEALELFERADRLQRQFFQIGNSESRGPTWEPPVDVFETEGAMTILVALPGVTESDIEIVIDGGALITMSKRAIPAPSGAMIHRLEIPFGQFRRRVELPRGQYKIGKRSLLNGCLRIDLSKLG